MKSTPKYGSRLLGTWKSDRKKTFEHYKPPADFPPEKLRTFRLIFGKMVIRWKRATYSTSFSGFKDAEKYKIIARDSRSVVIQSKHLVYSFDCLTQIHFEDDYYWLALDGGHMCEWFRRIK